MLGISGKKLKLLNVVYKVSFYYYFYLNLGFFIFFILYYKTLGKNGHTYLADSAFTEYGMALTDSMYYIFFIFFKFLRNKFDGINGINIIL